MIMLDMLLAISLDGILELAQRNRNMVIIAMVGTIALILVLLIGYLLFSKSDEDKAEEDFEPETDKQSQREAKRAEKRRAKEAKRRAKLAAKGKGKSKDENENEDGDGDEGEEATGSLK